MTRSARRAAKFLRELHWIQLEIFDNAYFG